MSTVYIYRKWISTDEELMNEQIFEYLGQFNDNVEWIENQVEWEWEDEVEEEICTQDEIDNYIKNGFIFVGKR